MDLEVIVVSRVSQRKTNGRYHLHVELKKKNTNDYLPNRNRLSDIENRLRITKGKRKRRDKLGVWD